MFIRETKKKHRYGLLNGVVDASITPSRSSQQQIHHFCVLSERKRKKHLTKKRENEKKIRFSTFYVD